MLTSIEDKILQLIEGKIPVFGNAEQGAIDQILTCAKTADRVALMADNHKGYAVPIGGVVAYKDAISPSGVGFDIACGNKAVRLDADANEVRKNISRIMDEVVKHISFGVGRTNNEQVEHEIFDKDYPGWKIGPLQDYKRKAQSQLGTVGSGNHYVDIFVDEMDRVWVGVHFGSRGLGHTAATFFLKAAGAKDGMDVEPCVIQKGTPIFDDYLCAMALGGVYAYAGRDWVCNRVASIIGGTVVEEVHNHHNFAWEEVHDGQKFWVVRKGATPAFPGQKGFVGGSMGENSIILEGVEHPDNQFSLCSTVHGAGRVMGRMQAKGKYKNGVCLRAPLINREAWERQMHFAKVELRGGGLDEAPLCYKRLPEVLEAHAGSIKILHTLTPIGVAMAGANEFDPYKD